MTTWATSSICFARLKLASDDNARRAFFQSRRDQWEQDDRGFEVFQSTEPEGLADCSGWTVTNLRSAPLVIKSFCLEGGYSASIGIHRPGIDWQRNPSARLPITLGIGEGLGFFQYGSKEQPGNYAWPVRCIKVETNRGAFWFDNAGLPLSAPSQPSETDSAQHGLLPSSTR